MAIVAAGAHCWSVGIDHDIDVQVRGCGRFSLMNLKQVQAEERRQGLSYKLSDLG